MLLVEKCEVNEEVGGSFSSGNRWGAAFAHQEYCHSLIKYIPIESGFLNILVSFGLYIFGYFGPSPP